MKWWERLIVVFMCALVGATIAKCERGYRDRLIERGKEMARKEQLSK